MCLLPTATDKLTNRRSPSRSTWRSPCHRIPLSVLFYPSVQPVSNRQKSTVLDLVGLRSRPWSKSPAPLDQASRQALKHSHLRLPRSQRSHLPRVHFATSMKPRGLLTFRVHGKALWGG